MFVLDHFLVVTFLFGDRIKALFLCFREEFRELLIEVAAKNAELPKDDRPVMVVKGGLGVQSTIN